MPLNDLQRHRHTGLDAEKVSFTDLEDLPSGIENAPLATISDPSGGMTVDSEARSAINDIIDRLQSLGLIQ